MPRPSPGRTPVFHILAIEKLTSVIEHGLWCDTEAQRRFGDQAALDSAHEELKGKRRRREVPVAQRGVMADYVPFYFGPRSPMLFTIKCGNTTYGRHGRGQHGMVHLVCRLETLARDLPDRWCFIDAHLSRTWAQFGNTLEELDERVDFDVMTARKWNEPDQVKAARQAEFLVHRVVPWEYVELVVVIDETVADEVRCVVERTGTSNTPDVRPQPPGTYPDSPFPHGYYYH